MEAAYYQAQFVIEDSHWWYLGRRRILHKLLSRFAPGGRSGKALEVGCGGGGNLTLLSEFSAQLAAVEMEATAVNAARSRGVGTIWQGLLGDELPVFSEHHDVIAMFDVLEHIQDDSMALRQVRSLLAPHGRLFISVPAYMFLWTRHDIVAHHCRRYTRQSLVRLLRANGYKVVYASYFNMLLFPLALLTLLYARMFSIDPEGAIRQPPSPLNWILRKIFSIESWLIPRLRLPFGLSIALVAERDTD